MRSLAAFALSTIPVFAAGPVEIRIIYDNTSAQPGIQADWGFSAVVTANGHRVLFDSGTKPELFLENLRKMDVAPRSIEAAVISHEHEDHRNGIYRLYPLYTPMEVHFLESFDPTAYAEAVSVGLQARRVNGPQEIVPGIYSSGLVTGKPDEQALVIPTESGLVVLTGCSHPGVVKMVQAARVSRGVKRVRLLAGGFHLYKTPEAEVASIVTRLRAAGVERVMPAHCTGEAASRILEKEYGSAYEAGGAGKRLRLE